jgi:hypothetical protein
MRAKHFLLVGVAVLLIGAQSAHALSRGIGRDIEFPEGYDKAKAEAILSIVKDEQFKFVGGLVSYWPPDWSTRLSFTGDAESLNGFLSRIRELHGIGLRVILHRGRNDELRRDSAWQLDFSHARPDQLTVYVNFNDAGLDLDKLRLPEWPAEK